MRKVFAVATVMVLMLSACSRGVNVGSDTSKAYRVEVHNSHTAAMTVSYTDSRGTHELGPVPAGETRPFVIASVGGPSVTLMGMTTSGGHYEKPVTLATGTTSKATL